LQRVGVRGRGRRVATGVLKIIARWEISWAWTQWRRNSLYWHSAINWRSPRAREFFVVGWLNLRAVVVRRRLVTTFFRASTSAVHADSGRLAGDFASNASAKRLGRTSRCTNDRRYLAHQRAQSQGRTHAAAGICSELLDLFVRGPVDLVELAPSVIDQLCNFIDHAGHRLVEVRLIHHRDGVPHVHAMHAINHLAGVVRIKPVSSSADTRRGVSVPVSLLAQRLCRA
jgi:hypothetical protein